MQYAFDALDALGWRWGPCHIELKWVVGRGRRGGEGEGETEEADTDPSSSSSSSSTSSGEPVLVELNLGRWNGVDFQLLTNIGYGGGYVDAYGATLDAYLDQDAWEAMPRQPPKALQGHARLVKLVSSVSGILVTPADELHADELASLRSLVRFETEAAERGEYVHRTVDLATCAGFATLLHADKEVVDAEYAQLRAMQERGLHEVAPE